MDRQKSDSFRRQTKAQSNKKRNTLANKVGWLEFKNFVYTAEKKDHKWSDCKTVTKAEDRKKILSEKMLF